MWFESAYHHHHNAISVHLLGVDLHIIEQSEIVKGNIVGVTLAKHY